VTRGLPTNTATQLSSALTRPIHFVKLEFTDTTLYLSDGLGSYTWGGGQTWTGVGDLGSISQAQEGNDLSAYGITLTLSGIDSTISSAALTAKYFMQPVTVYLGVLDQDDQLVEDPVQIWAGHGDNMFTTAGSEDGDTISYVCESELAQLGRSPGYRFTSETLQITMGHTGDTFFDWLPLISGKKVRWRYGVSDDTPGQPNEPADNVIPYAPQPGDHGP